MEKRTQPITPFLQRLPTAIAVVACLSTSGCNDKTPPPSQSATPPLSQVVSMDSLHLRSPFVQDFCLSQNFTGACFKDEATDDQKLNGGDGNYGPVVSIFPSDLLETRTTPSFDNIGEAVAAILIDPADWSGPLPVSYANLRLSIGVNCVYLKHLNGDNYRGFVIPGKTSGSDKCPDKTSLPNGMPFRATPHSSHPNTGDVPPAVRFHEANFHQPPKAPQPMIGVKCFDRWCAFGPSGTDIRSMLQAGQNPGDRKWAVRGWSDQQHLGVFTGTPARLTLSPTLEAAVIPGPATDLALETDFAAPAHAATVVLVGDPMGTKYERGWGFTPGNNRIWIQRLGQDSWTGRVEPEGSNCMTNDKCTMVRVERGNRGIHPPAIARFAWDEKDEGVWVRCADGCCKVSGY